MKIRGESQVGLWRARRWARKRFATRRFRKNLKYYKKYCAREGVRFEVAVAQYAKETAFGRYGGVIDASFKNCCGLKTTQGGSNFDPDAHQRFDTWEQGAWAHIHHLGLYAGALGYPRIDTPDPRHKDYLFNRAENMVENLGGPGKWAPNPQYGHSVASFARSMKNGVS